MAGLPEYLVGQKGVNLTQTPLHTPDGGLLEGRNVEFSKDQGIGGIAKRGGLARLNTSALAGSVLHLANMPFPYPTTRTMMLALNAETSNAWKESTDGATFVNRAASLIPRAASVTKLGTAIMALNGATFYIGQRPASYKRKFYWPTDDYTAWVSGGGGSYSPPPIGVWNGTAAFTVVKLPTNPTSPAGSYPWLIADMWVQDGIIFLAVFDPGGTAPNHKGRVLAFDPEDVTLSLVGNRFGNGTGENGRGYPHCLASYQGRLWVGTNAISGTSGNMGSIWSIQAGVDDSWTEERQLAGVRQGYMSLLVFNGSLYAATSAGVTTSPIIEVRSATGTWATSYTSAISAVSYIGGLIAYNDELYACEFDAGNHVTNIKRFNGTSWSTDYDVATNNAPDIAPGTPFVLGDELFWPFFDPLSSSDSNGFFLKKSSGAWSTVLTGLGLRGCMGFFYPDAS